MDKEIANDADCYIKKALKAKKHLTECIKNYDMDLYKHSQNVAVLSYEIGRKLGFSKNGLDDLVTAAFLHDIGKTCISSEFLKQIEPFTDDELYIIRSHSLLGANFCEKKGIKTSIIVAILLHHEREDGNGYPLGILGRNIPPMAKIIAVADSYDAMISDRGYNQPFDKEIAHKEITNNAGILYDTVIVEAFKQIKLVEV